MLVLLQGCSLGTDLGGYTPPNGQADAGDDVQAETGDTPGDTPDVPDVPDPVECSPEQRATCSDVAGAQLRSCLDGRCLYACVGSFVDVNADLDRAPDGDGCECMRAEEVCDGRDNDCDGLLDETYPGQGPCPDAVGVCSGAATSCGEQSCNEALYERVSAGAYTHKLDGVCDQLDNDCDNSVDENCCTADFLFKVAASENRNYQGRPSLAVSPTGDTAVAWAESNSSLSDNSVDTSARVRYRVLGPSLENQTPASTLLLDDDAAVAQWPQVASDGESFWLTYVERSQTSILYEVRLRSGGAVDDQREIGRGGLRELLYPATDGHAGRRVTAWVDTSADCVGGAACVRLDLKAIGQSPTHFAVAAAADIGPVAVATRDDRTIVLWAEETTDAKSIAWRGYDGTEPGFEGRVDIQFDDARQVHPAVTATDNGWAIAYQDQTGLDHVHVLTLEMGGQIVPPGFQISREGAAIDELVNVALAGDSRVGVLHFDGQSQRLRTGSFAEGDGGIESVEALAEGVTVPKFGLDLTTDPRTQLVGAAALDEIDGESSEIVLFWINYNGSTLCR